MHEVSVAQTIIDAVMNEAKEQKAVRILGVTLALGELTMINTEQIVFWIQSFLEGTIGEGAFVNIETIHGKVQCNNCNVVTDVFIEDDGISHYIIPDFTCGHCNSKNTFICQGREMIIKGIRIER
ncbi:MAG: hydrogenase maturation nickel metallochaperone HypA/HybF [Candidatus Methanofastidiosia archaeon]